MLTLSVWGDHQDDTDLLGIAQAGLLFGCAAVQASAPMIPGGEGVIFMSVDLRPGESQDSILKRFRKSVAEARILPIVRQKRWFTPRSEVRRIKRQKAIRKSQRPPRE